jgi:hypothetical protein
MSKVIGEVWKPIPNATEKQESEFLKLEKLLKASANPQADMYLERGSDLFLR